MLGVVLAVPFPLQVSQVVKSPAAPVSVARSHLRKRWPGDALCLVKLEQALQYILTRLAFKRVNACLINVQAVKHLGLRRDVA